VLSETVDVKFLKQGENMSRYYLILMLLLTIVFTAACGASSQIGTSPDRSASKFKAGADLAKAHADVEEVGYPSHVRLWAEYIGTVTIVKWEWRVSDGSTNQWPLLWHDATADGGVYWLQIDKPGTINAELRGIDANGNTCTSSIKIRARNNYNSPPVVLFDGPLDYGEKIEPQSDGTVLRYHEWGWDASRSYDPETSIASIEWGVYGGGDLDGDGIPDTLYAGITAEGVEFSNLLGFWLSKKGYDYYQVQARITPELRDDSLEMVVTVTDTAGSRTHKKTGHVSLLK
jgi:hypothetical protein